MDQFISVPPSDNDYPTVGDIYSKINESAFAVLLSIGLISFFGLRYLKKSATAILESDRAADFFDTIKQVAENQRTLAEMQSCSLEQKEQMDALKSLVVEIHHRIDQFSPILQDQSKLQQYMIDQLRSINTTLTLLENRHRHDSNND